MITEHKYIEAAVLFDAVEEALQEGRNASFTVTGWSMWPFLYHGRDSVTLRRVDADSLRRGDIVFLHEPGTERYLLHRVTGLGRKTVETTGDGNLHRDGSSPKTWLVGKVVRVERAGKEIDCGSFGWRLLGRLWMLGYPLRGAVFALRRVKHRLIK